MSAHLNFGVKKMVYLSRNRAMSCNRFTSLLRCLRFDKRADRNVNDKFASVGNVFEMMVSKFRSSYRPGISITVDEQMVTFRGRCGFKMFLKEKSDKYGMKIWALVDTSTSYCLNLQPYLGRIRNQDREQGQRERVVLELTDFIYGSGCHITGNNFSRSCHWCNHF